VDFIGERESGTDATDLGGNERRNQRLDRRAVTLRVCVFNAWSGIASTLKRRFVDYFDIKLRRALGRIVLE
jgi:hypothetical protein